MNLISCLTWDICGVREPLLLGPARIVPSFKTSCHHKGPQIRLARTGAHMDYGHYTKNPFSLSY